MLAGWLVGCRHRLIRHAWGFFFFFWSAPAAPRVATTTTFPSIPTSHTRAHPHTQVAAVFGGAGKWEQTKLLKEGCEILVATPGACNTDSSMPPSARRMLWCAMRR
jgi:hypothetical protein